MNIEKKNLFKNFIAMGIIQILNYVIPFDINLINNEQRDYLARFFNKDVIVIGFELYDFSKILTSLNCKVIDLAYHSYKLFDDTYWGYAQLDPIKGIPNPQEAIKNMFMKYIAPHF